MFTGFVRPAISPACVEIVPSAVAREVLSAFVPIADVLPAAVAMGAVTSAALAAPASDIAQVQGPWIIVFIKT